MSGPGALEVLAGGNIDLGQGTSPNIQNVPGTNLGITTIGGDRNPFLQQESGAAIIMAAGLGGSTSGLTSSSENYQGFINNFLNPNTAPSDVSSVYLGDLGSLLGINGETDTQIWTAFSNETQDQQAIQATTVFYDVLRDAGRNHNNPASLGFGNYNMGFAAIAALFPASNNNSGNISLTSREIKTSEGGDIDMLVPGGEVDAGVNNLGAQAVDQGILTVDGGNISIFANGSINVGTSRIFTLHGGNIIIWSSTGDIAAGAASRTVQSRAPDAGGG